MENSFSQLLNEGISEGNEQIGSQAQLSQEKGRSKNFSIAEDMLLISAWENISMDPIRGNNQTQTNYWSRITSYFDEHKSFKSERTPIALSSRWSTIQKAVSKFQGFFSQIEGRNQSGIGEVDKVRQAMEMYQSIQGSAFAFSHCWAELRNSPKFASSMSKKNVKATKNDGSRTVRSSQSPVSLDCDQECEDGLERPMGRKAAKKRKRIGAESQSESSKTFFDDMREYMSTSATKRQKEYETMVKIEEEQLELKRKEVKINEAREKREQQVYEASILAIDTTKMDPPMANYYNSLKAEIFGKTQ